jgi:hypothetical protein
MREIVTRNELQDVDSFKFYTETQTDNGVKVKIKIAKVIEFWENRGFRTLKLPKGSYELVKIKSRSIICLATEKELMQEIKHQLLTIENKPNVWEVFMEGDYITKRSNLALNMITEFKLNSCDSKTAYFFFKNGILKVMKDSKELIQYEDYDGYVFENQINDHSIVILGEKDYLKSEFDVFLKKVSNNNLERYNHLTSALGYIIHGYKDPSFTKALILVDETVDFSGEANGGTGKSIIGKAVSFMTSTLTKDGKSLNTKGNKFFYQDLNLSHKILNLDDVTKDLNFEDFYSVVTGELPIEEKYKSPYKIPFELSPKLMISSNYMVKGSGGNSDERRRVEIEIFPYYSIEFSPMDDFGKRLFDDWDETEMNCFYNDMASYNQKFMINGIMTTNPINLKENKLKMETDTSFVEFVDMDIVFNSGQIKVTKNKQLLYNLFREKYPAESRTLSALMFKKWLDLWGKARGLEVVHRKSDSNSLVDFIKK